MSARATVRSCVMVLEIVSWGARARRRVGMGMNADRRRPAPCAPLPVLPVLACGVTLAGVAPLPVLVSGVMLAGVAPLPVLACGATLAGVWRRASWRRPTFWGRAGGT